MSTLIYDTRIESKIRKNDLNGRIDYYAHKKLTIHHFVMVYLQPSFPFLYQMKVGTYLNEQILLNGKTGIDRNFRILFGQLDIEKM